MQNKEILHALTSIFRNELDNESIILTETSGKDDIEEWDSLSHIYLMVAIEKYFAIKFTTKEIQELGNAGDICISINKKLTRQNV